MFARGSAANALYAMYEGKLVSIQQVTTATNVKLCGLDHGLHYKVGNASEILARMDARDTTRKENMAYALTVIFSIHLTIAYGERQRARERLLKQLVAQTG